MTTSASPLDGAFNFRDVGGATIRRRRLFRSDTLQFLTAGDKRLLTDRFGIRCVLDLRSTAETSAESKVGLPDDARYAHIPLGTAQSGRSHRLEEIYIDYLEHDVNLPAAIEVLSVLLPRPTIVHCASGKDRTGIVTALALGLAGAPRELIVEDYLRSADNMPYVVERFRHLDLPSALFQCTESAIGALLDAVEDTYGDFTGWAEHSGISGETILRLRRSLTFGLPRCRFTVTRLPGGRLS
ncbi:tyrosine-protein phosphatase [Nocardia thraciensis]